MIVHYRRVLTRKLHSWGDAKKGAGCVFGKLEEIRGLICNFFLGSVQDHRGLMTLYLYPCRSRRRYFSYLYTS